MIPTAIHVISRSDATDRREAFAEQARLARSSWRFVDAATAPSPTLPYDEARARGHFGRALSPGEVACFVSHHAAWQSLLASEDRQRLVLEDDALVEWNTVDRLVSLDMASFELHLVRLYATHPFQYRMAIHRFLGPHIHLVQVRGLFLGCQGYLITRHAAAQLVRLAATIDMPVDWFMTRYWAYGFRNYCVFPFPIVERYVPSHIGDRSRAASSSSAERATRLGFRVRERLSRALADHVTFGGHPFGRTHDAGVPFADGHDAPTTRLSDAPAQRTP